MYIAGNNCEIAYNDVSASQKINSDSGVFYTVGNASLKNTEIHHNWFHDATAPSYSHADDEPGKAAGIYLDNNSKGYVVHHNVVWNVSWTGYQVNWNNTDLDFFHNTIWNASSAMDSWVNGYSQQNNKIYNNFANTGSWFAGNGPAEFDIQDNLITAVSPFEDANNQDFMPVVSSAVVDQAMVISGFPKLYKGSGPDIGAYENGGTPWTAGPNAIEDTGEPLSVSEFKIETGLNLYPNPSSTFLNIGFRDNESLNITAVEIYSVLGNLLKSMSVDQTTRNISIPVQNFSSGIYLIKVISQRGAYSGKFIKK